MKKRTERLYDYDCEIRGTITVEASNEEEAKEKASASAETLWDWSNVEVESRKGQRGEKNGAK